MRRCGCGVGWVLLAYAVELVLGADVEVVICDGDAGAHGLVAALGGLAVAHFVDAEEFVFGGVGCDDVDLAPEVGGVDFAIGGGGGGLELGLAAGFCGPEDFAGLGLCAGEGFAVGVKDVKVTLVEEGGGDVAGDDFGVGRPKDIGISEGAGFAEREAEGGVVLGRADDGDAVSGHGAGDEAPVADFFMVPGAPTPDFFAGGGVVTADAVAASDEHLALACVVYEDGGGEGLKGLGDGVAGAVVLPEVFAGGGVDGEDEGAVISVWAAFLLALINESFVALEDLDVELAVV